MSEIYLVDSHTHLEEIEDLDQALSRARNYGVVAIVTVGSDYESNHRALEIADKYKPLVHAALGSHPWDTGACLTMLDRNLQFIQDNLKSAVAIGEVGLDYHKEVLKKGSKEQQKYVLSSILKLCKEADKPTIIHSRYSWRDSFTLIKEIGVKKAIFHWYTGPINVLKGILDQGYLISATPATEYHEEHRQAIAETPLQSLVLETDSPVRYRQGSNPGYKSEPADVARTLQAVAILKNVELTTLAEKTTENALAFYRIAETHDGQPNQR